MKRTVRNALIAALVVPVAVWTAAAAGPPPHVTFDHEGLVIAGSKPGVDVAWISVVRDRPKDVGRVITSFGAVKVPASGAARVAAHRPEAARGLWIVADTDTGAAAHAAPPGQTVTRADVTIEARAEGPTVSIQAPVARVLYVRPGRGAWTLLAHDGSPADVDGLQNGVIVAALDAMAAVRGNAKPPDALAAGDVILAVDVRWMRAGKLEVAP